MEKRNVQEIPVSSLTSTRKNGPKGTTGWEPVRWVNGKRSVWISVCSAHPHWKEGCHQCQAGDWYDPFQPKFKNLEDQL